jgi:uncharacterized membrane protein
MNHDSSIPTLESLKKSRKPLRNVNIQHCENLSYLERLAIWITEHVGAMGFFLVIFVWTTGWLLWNMLGPKELRFDPYPAFVQWLFISNMIQLFLLPLIMIGQNLQSRHSEARAEADFEINTKTEKETEAILMHLEHQNKLISEVLHRLNQRD